MPIQANAYIPPSKTVEINREKDMNSNNKISISFNIDVKTHYPAYMKEETEDDTRNLLPKKNQMVLDYGKLEEKIKENNKRTKLKFIYNYIK